MNAEYHLRPLKRQQRRCGNSSDKRANLRQTNRRIEMQGVAKGPIQSRSTKFHRHWRPVRSLSPSLPRKSVVLANLTRKDAIV